MEKAFPAIVSKAQFRRVGKHLSSRAPKFSHPRRVGSSYLLSGLVKCQACNTPLTGQFAKSGQYSYYVCQSNIKLGNGACKTPRLNARHFEEMVVAKIRSNILTEGSIRDLVKVVDEEMDGAADVAETTYTPFQTKPDALPARLIVRRVKPTPGSQLALFARYSYHAFITDRDGETLELEADHRRHAEVENAIRDLKYGVGLNHMPSGRFAANGAWLAVQVMAHNLARWTARIGLGERTVITKTLRRRVFALVGRITRSARRLTLHLPRRWPWETQFSRALARLQAIPFPA